jgi:hypothetical protein
MPPQVLAKRIERLEEQMTSLQDLPGEWPTSRRNFSNFETRRG